MAGKSVRNVPPGGRAGRTASEPSIGVPVDSVTGDAVVVCATSCLAIRPVPITVAIMLPAIKAAFSELVDRLGRPLVRFVFISVVLSVLEIVAVMFFKEPGPVLAGLLRLKLADGLIGRVQLCAVLHFAHLHGAQGLFQLTAISLPLGD